MNDGIVCTSMAKLGLGLAYALEQMVIDDLGCRARERAQVCGGGGGRRLDSSIVLMIPTEFPSGSSTIAYRAPQKASSGACWLRCPAAITRACTRSTSSRDGTWKNGIIAEPSFGFHCFANATLPNSTCTPFESRRSRGEAPTTFACHGRRR